MAENFLRTDIDNNSEAKEGQRNSKRITKKKDTQIQHGSYSETVGSLKIDFKAFKGEKKKKNTFCEGKKKKKRQILKNKTRSQKTAERIFKEEKQQSEFHLYPKLSFRNECDIQMFGKEKNSGDEIKLSFRQKQAKRKTKRIM